MGTLYVGIDFFCPGAFAPAVPLSGAETYPYESKSIFGILQAALTTDPLTDPIAPKDYFELTGATLANHNIVFITDEIGQDLLNRIRTSAIPVPFPPETSLAVHWQLNPATPTSDIKRVIPTIQRSSTGGLSSLLLLPVTDWPLFSESNFALPPISKYADLSLVRPERRTGIQNQLMSWATSLATTIIRQHRDQTPPPTAAENRAYNILADLDNSLGPADLPKPQTDANIRIFLSESSTPGGTPRIGLLWEALLTPPPPGDPRPILPPRFLHDLVSLSSDPVRILELGDPAHPPFAVSYHQVAWQGLRKQIAADAAIDGAAVKALGRLYAFGERLRWPQAAMGDPAFMVVDETASRAAVRGWSAFGTNMHSLMGQVFRLPVTINDGIGASRVKFEVQSQTSRDLGDAVRLLVADALLPRTQSLTIGRDGDRKDGFFLFAPKMAQMTAGRAPTGGAVPYSVPTSLLDATDKSPRWSAPAGGPTLAVSSPSRTGLRQAELYLPDLAGPPAARRLALPARLLKLPQTFQSQSALFELVVAGIFHADEIVEITARFMGIAASGSQLLLTIQAAPFVASWDTTGQVLDVQQDTVRGLVATLVDRGGASDRLVDLISQVSSPVPGGKDDATLHGISVDLLLPPGPSVAPLFNRVLGGRTLAAPADPTPLCILNGSFTSRLSACTDRILDRFELCYAPSPYGAPDSKPVDQQFGDFNKLRLALSSTTPEITSLAPASLTGGRWVEFLTYPDAVTPMPTTGYTSLSRPWQAAAPPTASRYYGYFLSQIFTQDARVDDKSDPAQRLAAESLRYINYLTPQVPWQLEGYAEHQYTFRFPLMGSNVALPLASDIQNPASLSQRSGNEEVPLIRWTFLPATNTLELAFPRKYLSLATTVQPGADARPSSLRAIYEPLSDLIAAIDRGTAQLLLERWAFDPDGPGTPSSGGRPSPADSGALTSNMRLLATHRRLLSPSDPVLAPLTTVRTLLRKSLADFESAVSALASGTTDAWLNLSFPCDAKWSGLTAPAVLASDSDVLRLGLELVRAADSVIPAAFVDPNAPEATPGFGLPVDATLSNAYPELVAGDFGALHDAAAAELGAYLSLTTPSSLRRRFDWIRALRQPVPLAVAAVETDPERVTDPRRFQRLFGETATFLVAPTGARPPVNRVLDVYYVPFGILPLRPHPKIGDSETTLEFAEFLARILDDICSGRDPQEIEVAPLVASDAYAVRKTVGGTFLSSVAASMAKLVTWVHNDSGAAAADSRFAYVHALTSQAIGSLQGTLSEMFHATPGLFSTTKGFGITLFESDSWSSRLHSLQLRTQIHPANLRGIEADPTRFDVHQTAFRRFRNTGHQRYAVDVLDDKRYDNEFEIEECVFDPPRPAWIAGGSGVDLGKHRLRQRGDLQARTGEDVVEQRDRFDDQISGRRQLEADAVHWNPSWTLAKPGVYRRFYLLPSRRRPATPVKVKPRPSELPPRCSFPLSLAGPLDRPQLNALLSAAIQSRLNANKTTVFGTSGQSDLKASRLAKPIWDQIRVSSGLAAPGWWHLEAYVSEHYFVVEADEEATGPDGPFNNDRFRIEVDLGDQPFADEDPPPPKKFSVEGALGAWFTYQRLKAADPTGGNAAPPSPVQRSDLESELVAWLNPTSPNDGLLVPAVSFGAQAGVAVSSGDVDTVVSWFSPGKTFGTRLRSSGPQGIGSVLAAEVMQLATDTPSPDRFVIKVMVLDEPWRFTRVRIRTERNLRDVNDDDIPDINPAFQMFGDFSNWSSHGREATDLDFRDMTSRHLPVPLAAITPIVPLSDFLKIGATTLDYGDQLGAALNASFTDSSGGTQYFWNQAKIRSKAYGVTGLIVQRRPDLHPRYAQAEQTDKIYGRYEDIPRLHLPPFISTPADPAPRDFSQLLQAVDKKEVPSPHHAVEVMWSLPGGGAVLNCIWPVRFTP